MKKILFLLIIFLGIFWISPAVAQIKLEVPIEGEEEVSNLADYIVKVYVFATGVVGLAAVIMIMIGGYLYMTSHGNAAQAEKGKDFITSAVLGLIIVLVSYVILRTINPNLVENFRTDFSLPSSGNGTGTSGNGQWQSSQDRFGNPPEPYTRFGEAMRDRYRSNATTQEQHDTLNRIYYKISQLDPDSQNEVKQNILEYINRMRETDYYNNPENPTSTSRQISDELRQIEERVDRYYSQISGEPH